MSKSDIQIILKNIHTTGQLAKALSQLPPDTSIQPVGSDLTMLAYKPSEGRAYLEEDFSGLSEDDMDRIDEILSK